MDRRCRKTSWRRARRKGTSFSREKSNAPLQVIISYQNTKPKHKNIKIYKINERTTFNWINKQKQKRRTKEDIGSIPHLDYPGQPIECFTKVHCVRLRESGYIVQLYA